MTMSADEFTRVVELLRQLDGAEKSGSAWREAYHTCKAALELRDTPTVFATLEALTNPLQDDGYWLCVSCLRNRPDEVVFDTCRTWALDARDGRRRAAADILAQLGVGVGHGSSFAGRTWGVLEPLIEDDCEFVISAALYACGHLKIGAPSKISRHAAHTSTAVRSSTVHALSGRDDPVSISRLIALSRDVDADIRNWATFGLGQQTDVDTSELRTALLERIGDTDDELAAEIRGEALIGLARRHDSRVLPHIEAEIARPFNGAWCIEAAATMPAPQYAALLIALKARLMPQDLSAFGRECDDAIAACAAAGG